jgi:hypothetical protein
MVSTWALSSVCAVISHRVEDGMRMRWLSAGLGLGLGLSLALTSAGTALAEDISISPSGPSGIVTMPAERFGTNQPYIVDWTNPEHGPMGQGQASGGPLDNNVGAGHATYSSGDFQGDIDEGLSNEGWRMTLGNDDANGGSQPNSPDT